MPKVQLVELYAHGLGVIDDASLEFGPGFNVITGETGAGKTLLLGALGLCLGSDTNASRYALATDTRAVALFVRGDDEIALARETNSAGRLRSSLNGALSSVEALRDMAEKLVVVHGQHDSLSLKSRSEIVRLVDESAGIDAGDLRTTRRRLREVRELRERLGGEPTARQRELEFLSFQLSEFDAVSITSEGELAETLEELTRLTDLRDGQSALMEVLTLLDADSEDSVLARFARTLSRVPEGSAYDEVRATLRDALAQSREAVHDLSALSDPDALDPMNLAALEERATVLQLLARKYGGSLGMALAAREELRTRYEELTDEAERLVGLDDEIRGLEEREKKLAALLRQARESAAGKLTLAVRAQLARVALGGAELRFVVDGDDGSDVQILFTPNIGQPEGPLAALASGGELSRVLLAISLETAKEDVVAVFDEIDTGLGGQVAQQIGECLFEVGRRQQVLAVTHLATVAARADHHFVIEKVAQRNLTHTTVRALHGEDRVMEIARMLAGDVTSRSRALAQQLLENASKVPTETNFSR